MKFSDVYSKLELNFNNHLAGDYNCIPFQGMERLERFVPGIEHSTYYLLTANSGVGKSKLMRNLFIQNPYEYIKTNPGKGDKLSVLYFSLEESKEKVILAEISKYLFYKYGLSVSTKQLQSVGRYNTINPEILVKIKEAEEYIDQFLDTVHIFDNIRNPTGIYKKVRDFAMSIGDYYDSEGRVLDKVAISRGQGNDYSRISKYQKHDPKHYVIVIVDHIKLLSYEGDLKTTKAVMDKYSSEYCLHMRDKFGFTVVNVQQQASDKEKIQYTATGRNIEEKVEPSLDGLGEHKLTAQDCNVAMGLFDPSRYFIKNHNGYNIEELGSYYRSLNILKNRDGEANMKVPLFFNGASDYFKEMPRLDNEGGINAVKRLILELEQQKLR